MTGVGTKKVYEDDRVIVWRLDLPAGEHGARHTHELDFMVRIFSGSTLEVYGPNDELLYEVERTAGEVAAFETVGGRVIPQGATGDGVPATHSVKNVGPTPFREVLVEFKR